MNENTAPAASPSTPAFELKPCRFCGLQPELSFYGPSFDPGFFFFCSHHCRSIYCASPDDAAVAWNDEKLVFLKR